MDVRARNLGLGWGGQEGGSCGLMGQQEGDPYGVGIFSLLTLVVDT